MTKIELFIELAKPNDNGVSRWVDVIEFIGKYDKLVLGNGLDWGRTNSSIAKKYIIETQKKGVTITRIRLNGFNNQKTFNQNIKQSIKNELYQQNCVFTGIRGTSVNTKIEIDHKDGRKNDDRVSNVSTQLISDFQPTTKAANDAKRQICKECKESGKRWKASNLKGLTLDFYKGDETYNDAIGCEGCYQYDPVAYREFILKKDR